MNFNIVNENSYTVTRTLLKLQSATKKNYRSNTSELPKNNVQYRK